LTGDDEHSYRTKILCTGIKMAAFLKAAESKSDLSLDVKDVKYTVTPEPLKRWVIISTRALKAKEIKEFKRNFGAIRVYDDEYDRERSWSELGGFSCLIINLANKKEHLFCSRLVKQAPRDSYTLVLIRRSGEDKEKVRQLGADFLLKKVPLKTSSKAAFEQLLSIEVLPSIDSAFWKVMKKVIKLIC
jgi:hypothetical protein